jgi:hypothetical protein
MASDTADGLYIGICREDGVLVQDITGREDEAFDEAAMTRQLIEAGQLNTSTWNPQPELMEYEDLNKQDQDMRIFACASPDEFYVTDDRTGLPTQARMAITAGAETIRVSRLPCRDEGHLWDAGEADHDSAVDYIYRRDNFDRRVAAAAGEDRILEDYADELAYAVEKHMAATYTAGSIDRDYIRREANRMCEVEAVNV